MKEQKSSNKLIQGYEISASYCHFFDIKIICQYSQLGNKPVS